MQPHSNNVIPFRGAPRINDQRAYQAASNVIHFRTHRQQREQLEQLKDRLARHVIDHYPHKLIPEISRAIIAGQSMLEQGATYERSLRFVVAYIRVTDGKDPA